MRLRHYYEFTNYLFCLKSIIYCMPFKYQNAIPWCKDKLTANSTNFLNNR
jgi:hypothetical protein